MILSDVYARNKKKYEELEKLGMCDYEMSDNYAGLVEPKEGDGAGEFEKDDIEENIQARFALTASPLDEELEEQEERLKGQEESKEEEENDY